jgi:hypothetical protein
VSSKKDLDELLSLIRGFIETKKEEGQLTQLIADEPEQATDKAWIDGLVNSIEGKKGAVRW